MAMKRARVFLVVAPLLVLVTAFLLFIAIFGDAKSPGFLPIVAMVLSILTLPVSAIAGSVDGYLAHVLPMHLRAPLTAIVGATASYGIAFAVLSDPFPWMVFEWFALGGAVVMAVCSLLSHDYGGGRRPSVKPAGT